MTDKRWLIVNADDFGFSPGINQGILTAHTHGIVTSASLMVRWPAAQAAALAARTHPTLSLGLHIDLGEWIYHHPTWVARYTVVPLDDGHAIAQEIAAQLRRFHHLTGHNPTHLDSHQHVHRREPVATIMADIARTLAIPLRQYRPGIRYCGDFYGQTAHGQPLPQAISVERLLQIIHTLPPGITELACHPAAAMDHTSIYRAERLQELHTLCDRQIADALHTAHIHLCSFETIKQSASYQEQYDT